MTTKTSLHVLIIGAFGGEGFTAFGTSPPRSIHAVIRVAISIESASHQEINIIEFTRQKEGK